MAKLDCGISLFEACEEGKKLENEIKVDKETILKDIETVFVMKE